MDSLTRLCLVLFCTLPLAATLAAGACTCDVQEDTGKSAQALRYKIVAIAAILVSSALGFSIPMLGKIFPALSAEKDVFFVIKAFSAGVILATGFSHVLADAFDNLTSPCLAWVDFPFTGFIAMMAAIGCLMVDTYLTSYHAKSHSNKSQPDPQSDPQPDGEAVVPVHVHSHGHSHIVVLSDVARHRITTLVLETGIAIHSVIIGLSLGASQNPNTIRPLIGALTFHQFFEGMGIGGCIFQGQFKWRSTTTMGFIFSFSTPIGAVLGIIVSKSYKENSPTALGVQGSLNAASAGVLIYNALVNLLAVDFNNPRVQSKSRLRMAVNVALLLGAGCMALMAKWA